MIFISVDQIIQPVRFIGMYTELKFDCSNLIRVEAKSIRYSKAVWRVCHLFLMAANAASGLMGVMFKVKYHFHRDFKPVTV